MQVLDYYPYGGLRIDSKTDYSGVRNKYAGTVYDALSGLNYMQRATKIRLEGNLSRKTRCFGRMDKQVILDYEHIGQSLSEMNALAEKFDVTFD